MTDEADRIISGAMDGTIQIYSADGAVLDPSFVTGLGWPIRLALGRGGAFGADLYAIDWDTGELLRIDDGGGVTVFGSGFSLHDSITFGPDGAMYVAQLDHDVIYRITETGLNAGLVGYWNFDDGTAKDSSGVLR